MISVFSTSQCGNLRILLYEYVYNIHSTPNTSSLLVEIETFRNLNEIKIVNLAKFKDQNWPNLKRTCTVWKLMNFSGTQILFTLNQGW